MKRVERDAHRAETEIPPDPGRKPGAPIELDYGLTTAGVVGPAHGLTREELHSVFPRLREILEEMRRTRQHGRPEFLELPVRTDLLQQVRDLEPALEGFDTFVLLGIGGSALGPRAILEAAWGPYHLSLTGRPGGPPRRVFIADNIDPDSFADLLSLLDLKTTVFNVVSKSGSTVETMAQLAIAWREVGLALGAGERRRHFVVTTDPHRGFLRELARRESLASLEIPEGVGGRYSVLTPVGLLPALAGGVSPEELLQGAAEMDARCRTTDPGENPAAVLAALHHLLEQRKGKTVAVMMPYSDHLRTFAEWFCQLWAESLGKSEAAGGERRAPVGQTTVRALGTTDQHSQIQLFLEGPNDKLVTLIHTEQSKSDLPLESPGITDTDSTLNYLRGHSLGHVFRTEGVATEMALALAQRPTLVWRLGAAGIHELGQLFQVYETACVLAGGLYHINPFDQPGVELGKNLTYGALGRGGFEAQGDEVSRYREQRSSDRV